MAAGTITIKLTANDGELQAKMAQAQRTIGAFEKGTVGAAQRVGRAMKAGFDLGTGAITRTVGALTSVRGILLSTIAIAGTSRLAHGFKEAAEYVDALGKRARVLAVPTEFLSALTYAADLANIDPDTLGKAAAKAMLEVARAVKEGKKTLEGIRLMDPLTGQIRSIQELLPDIAKKLRATADQAEKIRLADAFFGRGGSQQFVQLVEESGDALERIPKLMEEARKTGAVFSADQTRRAAALNDSWTRIQLSVRGVKFAIANELAPVLTDFFNSTADRLGSLSNAIPKAAALLRDIAGGTQDPDRKKAIADLNASAKSLFLVTAKEVGKLGGLAFVQAIEIGIEALRPPLTALFQDALGPVLNKIPGVNIPRTARGQLEDLQREVAFKKMNSGYESMPGRIASMQASLDTDSGSFTDDANQRRRRRLEVLKAEHAELEAYFKDADAKMVAIQATADAEARTRGQALVDAVASGAGALETAVANAKANIGKAAAEFDSAVTQLDKVYTVTHPSDADVPKGPSLYERLATVVAYQGRRLIGLMKSINASVTEESKSGGSLLTRYAEAYTAAGTRLQELQARLLDAQGNDRAADRVRLLVKQAEELRKAYSTPLVDQAYIDRLKQVQSAELVQFDRGPRDKDKGDPKTFAQGWYDAIDGIKKSTEDWGVFTRDTLASSVKGFSDSWADALVRGEVTFKNFGKKIGSILYDTIAKSMSAVLSKFFEAAIGGAIGKVGSNTPKVEVTSSAHGNAFWGGNVVPFAAGGVTRGPEYFPLARGRVGLRGENGPEAIMPIQRVGGILGVRATGMGGGTVVNILDQRTGGDPVQVRESTGANGTRQIEVLIRDAMHKSVADGSMDRILGSTYGLRRKGTR